MPNLLPTCQAPLGKSPKRSPLSSIMVTETSRGAGPEGDSSVGTMAPEEVWGLSS